MNTDTPRTDELFRGFAASDEGYWRAVSHARLLERELNEAKEEIKWLKRELDAIEPSRVQWKAMAQEVISKFKHNHVNNGIDDACKQCGFDLRHEIHIRFNSINKCHHGIRDTATNLPYCRKCDEEGLK